MEESGRPRPGSGTRLLALWPAAAGFAVAALGAGSPPALVAGAAVALLGQAFVSGRRARDLARLAAWIDAAATGERPVRPEGLDSELEVVLGGPLVRLYRSARRERRRREELRRALESLVERFPDPLFLVDRELRIAALSAPAARDFATAADESLLGAVRDPGLLAALDAAIREGQPGQVEVSLAARPARRFTVQVVPLHLVPEGRGAAIVLREVTEQVAIERMRSDFVANASHELRTPLSVIAGAIETLQGPARDDPAAREEFLATMAAEAARMKRLVEDLLSLSQIEQSATQPPTGVCRPGEVVSRVVARLAPVAESTGVVIESRVGEPLPEVRGDADQLEQLLANLVDNAVRYGREGGRVIVEAEAVAAAPAGTGPVAGRPAVRLSVADFGPGIAPEHLPRLTERFYRIDKARSRSLGGTGLGLAIVKHILRRHQGHLQIDSELGRGSTFTVWLPAAAPADAGRHNSVTVPP